METQERIGGIKPRGSARQGASEHTVLCKEQGLGTREHGGRPGGPTWWQQAVRGWWQKDEGLPVFKMPDKVVSWEKNVL